jgi:hypothetical protein
MAQPATPATCNSSDKEQERGVKSREIPSVKLGYNIKVRSKTLRNIYKTRR